MTVNTPSRFAAIDIGTNSTNLLIVGDGHRAFHTVDTRLGEGVDASRRLAPPAIARTLATLADYRRIIDENSIERLVVVTTSAARDATNREDFLDAAEAVLGERPLVISGHDEGRLAFQGVASDLAGDVPRPLLIVDIGGGSTEFTVGTHDLEAVISANIGSVRLTEAELHTDPPRPHELTNAIGMALDHIDDVVRDMPTVMDVASVIGIGGTITTVAAVELGMMDRDLLHGFRLSRHAVEDVFRTLATESLADRLHNPGLPASRATVIVGGLCVLVAVMRRLHLDEVIVSQRTLLDGICADLAAGGSGVGPESTAGGEGT